MGAPRGPESCALCSVPRLVPSAQQRAHHHRPGKESSSCALTSPRAKHSRILFYRGDWLNVECGGAGTQGRPGVCGGIKLWEFPPRAELSALVSLPQFRRKGVPWWVASTLNSTLQGHIKPSHPRPHLPCLPNRCISSTPKSPPASSLSPQLPGYLMP